MNYLYDEKWVDNKGNRLTKPILLLDFDGVVHNFITSWTAPDIISDPPTPGLFEALYEYEEHFQLYILSSRSAYSEGIDAMKKWLRKWHTCYVHSKIYCHETFDDSKYDILDKIVFTTEKPPAYVILDDRAITFKGVFPPVEILKGFTPWVKHSI